MTRPAHRVRRAAAACAAALAVIGCLLAGCARDAAVSPSADGLSGSWQWVSSSGGIAGDTRTPEKAGYAARLVFAKEGRFEEYRNDSLVHQGIFRLTREQTPFRTEALDVVRYADGGGRMPQAVTFTGGDTLLLLDLCMVCYGHAYSRIR